MSLYRGSSTVRNAFLFAGLLSLFVTRIVWAAEANPSQAVAPQWIWSSPKRTSGQSPSFVKKIELKRPVASAILRCLGESTETSLAINGEQILHSEAYDPLQRIDVTDRLARGTNVLQVDCQSVAGPAAFFLVMEILFADGQRLVVVSDASWSCKAHGGADASVHEFGAVHRRLLIQRKQQVGISAVDNYEQWKQALGAEEGADPASFQTAPGFEIKLIRSARIGEDSWVSLAFDPHGRAIVAKEKQGLLRFELNAAGDQVTKTEVINDTLKECRGLLFAHDSLFANANNSKGLYRLRQKGRDEFETPELLYASAGGVGHGRNDLALGPDNKVYMIQGDSVHLPSGVPDYTSPFRDARRGKRTSEGHLLRVDPKDGQVEVVAAGLRNPFGVDFNAEGEPFTYDADAEYDMGSPWYRPTRVSHLVLGGDYGWRGVTKSWPPYYPDHADNALPNLDIGKGSPTAVKFGAKTNFSRHYREALYVLDWAYGRILAVHLTPRGASYVMTAETFLKGRPLNVTDLDVAPNGSMYLVTGGRGTRSALYRIRFTGSDANSNHKPTPQQAARRKFADRNKQNRLKLQALLSQPSADALQIAWPFLSDADPWLRHAARNVIEHQAVSQWRDKALKATEPTTAIQSLLCLARSGAAHGQVIRRLNQLDWPSRSRSDKLAALQCYWLCCENAAESLRSDTARKLSQAFPDASKRVNHLLSQLLVRFEAVQAYPRIVSQLNAVTDQRSQMHYLFVLRNSLDKLRSSDRKTYLERLAETRTYLGGAGVPDFVRRIREEALAGLSESERKRFADMSATPATPGPAATTREVVRQWRVSDLQTRLGEVGNKDRDVERGAKLFADAACVQCHRAGGRGASLGPDLTSVSRRFSRLDLLTSIIEPSKVVAEKYRSLQVITSDGKTIAGQVAVGGDYRSPVLRLAVNPLNPSEIVEIAKNEIEQQRASPISWMPEGLLNTLSDREIFDLLAYLESLAQSDLN